MWDTAAYERLATSAVAAVARYVEESQSAGVAIVSPPPLPELIDRLELRALVREGGLDAECFEPWLQQVLENTTRLHHPAEIAHQVGAPDVPAAVADLLHGVVNSPMSIYEMGPAAHAMERVVVE
jgi:L-2,4-diaminobutyrate decarboxylase